MSNKCVIPLANTTANTWGYNARNTTGDGQPNDLFLANTTREYDFASHNTNTTGD